MASDKKTDTTDPGRDQSADAGGARREAAQRRREREAKIRRERERIAIEVIRQNRRFDDLLKEIRREVVLSDQMAASVGNQRELVVRVKSSGRALRSLMGILSKNRLQLWMIDDGQINIEE